MSQHLPKEVLSTSQSILGRTDLQRLGESSLERGERKQAKYEDMVSAARKNSSLVGILVVGEKGLWKTISFPWKIIFSGFLENDFCPPNWMVLKCKIKLLALVIFQT